MVVFLIFWGVVHAASSGHGAFQIGHIWKKYITRQEKNKRRIRGFLWKTVEKRRL